MDQDSFIEFQAGFGAYFYRLLAKLGGNTVGVVASEEKTADGKACEKAARLVRFCDAFAIPVITFVNAESFCCIKAACKPTNAYAEATTAKISVITGEASRSCLYDPGGRCGRCGCGLCLADRFHFRFESYHSGCNAVER